MVYKATLRITGELRALKVARPTEEAEQALLREHRLASQLHHPSLVKVLDPRDTLVPDRIVLVMEHVEGQTLKRWLEDQPDADVDTRRRFAEDLLAALEYLEQENVTHNDLKPDNLLVGKGGLRVIDFSLACDEEGQPATGGTARYRDVASHVWSHATDRYAAALCLFELFVGRHAFGGTVRELDEELRIDDSEVEPTGLADFFRQALHHESDRRYASAHAMRDALRKALGGTSKADDHGLDPRSPETPGDVDAATGIHQLALSNRAVNQLRRSGVSQVTDLLALSGEQVRAIHSVGRKTAEEILGVQDELRRAGLEEDGAVQPRSLVVPALLPELAHDDANIHDLPGVSENLGQALTRAGLGTVGRLAGATRDTVLAVSGVGPTRLAKLLEALRQRYRHTHEEGPPRLIDQLWQRATQALTDDQREVLDRIAGVTGPPISQSALAEQRELTRARINQVWTTARESLDLAVLDEPASLLDTLIDGLGGLVPLATAAERLEDVWLGEEIRGQGLVRLLTAIQAYPLDLRPLQHSDEHVLTRPSFPKSALKDFEAVVWRLAESWPPVDPDVAGMQLRDALQAFNGDPATLAVRLFPRLHLMAGGELFVDTPDLQEAVKLVLERTGRQPTVEDVARLVEETFGGVVCPDPETLQKLLDELRPGGPRSIRAEDDPTTRIDAARINAARTNAARMNAPDALQEATEALRAAARSRGFRIVLTPPEKHRDIARSLARALDAHWISFEERWFEKHDHEIERMLRAERFAAQRKRLTRSADQLVDTLVVNEGEQGQTYVVGDTALLGSLDALDNIRYLYDMTLSGEHGFWIVVIPGSFAAKRQPLFNNVREVWHLEGIVVRVEEPIA